MGVREQVARLEQRVRADGLLAPPEPDDRCPGCGQLGLQEPDKEQLLTLASPAWSGEDATSAYLTLCLGRAWLCWCPACSRLVPAGHHGPTWSQEFGSGDYSPGFCRHLRDLDLLRKVQDFHADAALPGSKYAEPEPAPAPEPAGPLPEGADPAEWEWVPDGEDDDGMA
jgi:hypothetical protein